MERIESSTDTAIVSPLIILEIVDVTRKRLVEKERFQGLNPPIKTQINDRINSRIREILKRITILAKERKVMIVDPKVPIGESQNLIYKLVRSNDGEIQSKNRCSSCNQAINPPKYRYRILGHYDIQHALIAKEFSATEIVAFDKAFPQLEKFNEFDGIKITIPNL